MTRPFEIRKEVKLDAPPEAVWNAIATTEGLAAWFMPMPIDPESKMVVAWEPGVRLAISTPAAEDGSTQAFEYVIESRGGATYLHFVHSGFAGNDWSDEYEGMTGGGWDMYLQTLASYLRYFAGRRAVYVEAEAPASTAHAGAWKHIVERAGGGVVDAPVCIAVPGLEPIEGIIDYATPNFLGLRASDALIRFHGRWPIGMTIAVSHHAYTDVDAAAVTRAWRAWLASAFESEITRTT